MKVYLITCLFTFIMGLVMYLDFKVVGKRNGLKFKKANEDLSETILAYLRVMLFTFIPIINIMILLSCLYVLLFVGDEKILEYGKNIFEPIKEDNVNE